MRTDLRNQMDQNFLSNSRQTGSSRWNKGLHKISRNRPLAFALVVALSLALGACALITGQPKADYMNSLMMGNDYRKGNDFPKALECYAVALKEAEAKYGAESGQVATALGYEASIYKSLGEWRLAYMTYKRLIPLMDKFEPNTRDTRDLKKDFEFVKGKIIEYSIKTDDNYGADKMKKSPTANAKKPKKKH